jgi:hypothetical protein
MKKPVIIVAITLAILVIGSVAWLRAAPTIGAVAANPAYIVVNTPTQVVFTAQITDPSLISANLLRTDANGKAIATMGVMRDDGANGDAKAGDKVFSYRVALNQPSVGQVHYRVSAAFKGVLQRVLSGVIPVTIDPFTLPPDPGEAGKQTLDGIDSNGNGVRDDIERFIALRYANSPSLINALNQYATTLQGFFANNASEVLIQQADSARRRAAKCWDYLSPQDERQALDELEAEFVNTTERLRAYLDTDELLGGRTYQLLPPGPSNCQP